MIEKVTIVRADVSLCRCFLVACQMCSPHLNAGIFAAMFRFESPAVFEADMQQGEITGLYMNDEEGTIETVDVQAKFVNGKPEAIECKHVMRSALEWDRFMRFMERYAGENDLGFSGVRFEHYRRLTAHDVTLFVHHCCSNC
jgi:photosystem II reaction center protein Psb28